MQPHQSEECYLDRIRLQECLFYLKTHGKLLQLVAFYVRHGFVENACQLVLEKSASTEVFLEGILVPLLKNGHMSHLEDLMKGLDPTLRIWEPYLMSSCRYFSSRSLLHILYHIQLLMKVRAYTFVPTIDLQYVRVSSMGSSVYTMCYWYITPSVCLLFNIIVLTVVGLSYLHVLPMYFVCMCPCTGYMYFCLHVFVY